MELAFFSSPALSQFGLNPWLVVLTDIFPAALPPCLVPNLQFQE